MTQVQVDEFSKIELLYLQNVYMGDSAEQLRLMEVFFYWLKKELNVERLKFSVVLESSTSVDSDVTMKQKGEFCFFQMAMIKAFVRNDKVAMVEVEVKMREWIDIQLSKARSEFFKPRMKIIRK